MKVSCPQVKAGISRPLSYRAMTAGIDGCAHLQKEKRVPGTVLNAKNGLFKVT